MTEIKIFDCIGLHSKDTHNLIPYSKMFRLAKYLQLENENYNPVVIDPFARTCLWGTRRNDINPEYLHQYTTHCMDALDFLNAEATSQTDVLLFDPPFSDRQSKEEYGTSNLYSDPSYIKKLYSECFRILKDGGLMIKCGFDSNQPHLGMKLKSLYILNMGFPRYDIKISLWVKEQKTLTKLVGLA